MDRMTRSILVQCQAWKEDMRTLTPCPHVESVGIEILVLVWLNIRFLCEIRWVENCWGNSRLEIDGRNCGSCSQTSVFSSTKHTRTSFHWRAYHWLVTRLGDQLRPMVSTRTSFSSCSTRPMCTFSEPKMNTPSTGGWRWLQVQPKAHPECVFSVVRSVLFIKQAAIWNKLLLCCTFARGIL